MSDIVEVDCGSVPIISHASPGIVSTLADSVVNFTCDIGYVYIDDTLNHSIQCSESGLWEGNVTLNGCKRKIN